MNPNLIILTLMVTFIANKSKATESLCDRPVINAADRMANNTVRLYRGQVFWVLKGLPSDATSLEGPFPIPYKDMAPVHRNHSVVTLLGGTDRGKIVKTEGKSYWMWDEKGNLKTEKQGVLHNRFPDGGFDTVIHDGNPDDPTLIGFKGIKTFYLSTRYSLWTIDAKPSGYIGGKYKENFPTDVTAAFSLTASEKNDEYLVYFFRKDKFCKRTKILESGQQCDEWLPNRKLFGCDTQSKLFEAQNSDNLTETTTKPSSETDNKVGVGNKDILSQPAVSLILAMVLIAFQFTLFSLQINLIY